MGRPPCCDKVGIKKGPWTPEEDIILVTYIQQHGPGNWRSVPTNTGLLRCSKSCRLRWTNYLRPGIKRGNFTPHEEGMIIHLQALLGNKWAAIASYLPQRTDNDIKNYWNTHLKKKLKKFQSALDNHTGNGNGNDQCSAATSVTGNEYDHHSVSKSFFCDERIRRSASDHVTNEDNSNNANSSTTYASSTENISRLLEGWMRSSTKSSPNRHPSSSINKNNINSHFLHHHHHLDSSYHTKTEQEGCDELGSILSFDHDQNRLMMSKFDRSTCVVGCEGGDDADLVMGEKELQEAVHPQLGQSDNENKEILPCEDSSSGSGTATPPPRPPPLSFIEKWLLEESVGHVEDIMELSPMF